MQCLDYQQQCQMYRSISQGSGDYFQLKHALIQAYGQTLEQAQKDLIFAPGLGDKMPMELLEQDSRTAPMTVPQDSTYDSAPGQHLQENPLLSYSLKREFLACLPTYARDPLIIMRIAQCRFRPHGRTSQCLGQGSKTGQNFW